MAVLCGLNNTLPPWVCICSHSTTLEILPIALPEHQNWQGEDCRNCGPKPSIASGALCRRNSALFAVGAVPLSARAFRRRRGSQRPPGRRNGTNHGVGAQLRVFLPDLSGYASQAALVQARRRRIGPEQLSELWRGCGIRVEHRAAECVLVRRERSAEPDSAGVRKGK